MKRAIVLLSCLLLATPVVAQTTQQKPGAAPASVSAATTNFVNQVAISDLYETAAARLALARGNAAEKQFANQMLTDHGKTSADLRRMMVERSFKIDLPSQPDAAHQALLDKLNAANGEAFVAAYAAQQVQAHQNAVALFEGYADSGDFAPLKQWAAQTLPVLKHHLEMAQSLGPDAPTVGTAPAAK
jgi:putative membrane protein